MNLVAFSIKTKGLHNFGRRLVTVFTRFGFTEAPTRRALNAITEILQTCHAAPTFFIPAVVLHRHPTLLRAIVQLGVEVGVHGYVHNDYRTLSQSQQYKQTEEAVSVFRETSIPYQGFRNPYLGWTEEALHVFTQLGFTYDSNDAILHEVIDIDQLPPLLRSSYEKSLVLFQATPCNTYTLRPYFVNTLLRIPTSIPDDEMLFDRLRITNPQKVGNIWTKVMQRVYDLGGIYTLNLHPERALLCQDALRALLTFARSQAQPTWIAPLRDVAAWWKKRRTFRLSITADGPGRWQVQAHCGPRATLLARRLTVEDHDTTPWFGNEMRIQSQRFTVQAAQCPCIGLSHQTPTEVDDFLFEQGYPFIRCSPEEASLYTCYLDLPEGFGTTRAESLEHRSTLVQHIEDLDAPFIHFGCWPEGSRAALAITGDIDSITIQDFFLRILEVQQAKG